MLKQYFTDGLVQLAIVLSLLRTDLNSYFNHNYVNYPEVQEIILGPTAAYTQTNFHNIYNTYYGSHEIHRKNVDIDAIYTSSVIRDLRSFRHISQVINIPTYLLVSGSSNTALESSTIEETQEDINNNHSDDQQALSLEGLDSEDLEAEGQRLMNTLEQSIEAVAPLYHNLQGTDPTIEDLDLIEVLWRQDIDLGIGKEAFDINIRRELEREREIELQKERQKQKEQEVLQKKHEEDQLQREQRWMADNFTQDGETGEWVPLGGARVPSQPSGPELQTGDQSFLSTYDDMPLIGDELQQEQNFNVGGPQVNQMPPQGPYQGPQTMQPHAQPPPLYNAGNNFNQSQGFRGQPPPPPPMYNISNLNNSQGFAQQSVGYNANQTYQQSQGFNNQTQQNFNLNNMNRQSSLEQAWQDLVNVLELPQNQTQLNNHTQPDRRGMMMNSSMHSPGMGTGLDNSSSVLIQNATLPTPPPMNGNITGLNNTGLLSPSQNSTDMMRSPAHSSGIMSPGQSFNSTGPNANDISPVNWEPCSNFLFPNITNNLNQTEPIEAVEELLPDLITDDELESINFSDMGLNDAVTPTPTRHQDEASSDSAVSMGSQSVGSPEQNEFSDGAMSPFDGLEGATGGHDSYERSGFSKTSKYDPDDYKYSNSCSFSDSNGSNFSSSSNDTNGQDPSGYGHSRFSPNNNGHINHNHTYPLKPGMDPKDRKGMFGNKEPKPKGPHCRDYKRIDELKVPFSVDQIVSTPVEEFNDMLTRHKLTEPQLQLIRDIRRRGKNKVAAQNCRKRKMDVICTLEDEMTNLEQMRDKLLRERHMIDKQTRDMKDKLGNLYSDIFHSLRDEHGRPYDPMRFSLQQSSDGDVFLVPRNYTSEDDINKKRKNERK